MSVSPWTYKHLKVIDSNESIWVSPMEHGYEKGSGEVSQSFTNMTIVLVGPTGSGKSSFIEAIASNSTRTSLGIAKDQLESVTQQPSIYEIKNLRNTEYGGEIYIVDTPGFSDPRISELQVLEKLIHWRDRCQDVGYVRLLYFHPISDIRLPASRKRCLDMLQRFWGLRLSSRSMLVTSMWDRVSERSRNASEMRFTQLSTGHLGDWINAGSRVVKFENTFDSAMGILNEVCAYMRDRADHPEVSGLGMEGTAGNPVYEALLARLSFLEQQRVTLMEDLAHPESQGQIELMSTLTNDLAKTEVLLQKFNTEMQDFIARFGQPPVAKTSVPTDVVDSESPPHQADIINTPSTHSIDPPTAVSTHISETFEPRQEASLPKRFGRWIHKKVDKVSHFGRKGA